MSTTDAIKPKKAVDKRKERISKALEIIRQYSLIGGEQHKNWVIVEVAKILCGSQKKYQQFVDGFDESEDDDGHADNEWNDMIEVYCCPP